MYQALTLFHSTIRWLVLATLIYAICRAASGYAARAAFSKTDNAIRHWTATVAHMQLAIGIVLYTKSPLVRYFWQHSGTAVHDSNLLFFGLVHMICMLSAIVLLTIGSALAKRRTDDREKFKTMLIWFSLALLIIFIAIPWPFSPLATRPYYRNF